MDGRVLVLGHAPVLAGLYAGVYVLASGMTPDIKCLRGNRQDGNTCVGQHHWLS